MSLESNAPLDYFPVVAFSLSYELDYFQLVALLRAAGLPLRATERDESHPLLIAGGPAISANPEPLAPMLDAVLIGEIEPSFDQLTDALHRVAEGRHSALESLSRIPGLYVPAQARTEPIIRQWLHDLDRFPTYSRLLTPNTEFGDMGLIEIARGCGRGCRFCLAGSIYRPPRQRSVASILDQAQALLRHRDRLGLVSAAVSDYVDIDRLVAELRSLGARLSVSSLRVDPVSEALVRALAESGAQTLTIAPEAGSERLRHVINKTQTTEDLVRSVELASRYDLAQLKLYYMLGLPTERQADVQAIVDLTLTCARNFPRRITVNMTPFVPKAHTPFERLSMTPAKVISRRMSYVEKELRRRGIECRSESPAWAEVQGSLARGDRRLADAFLLVERAVPAQWRQALAKVGLSMTEVLRQRAADEPLPWSFVQTGMSPAYRERESRHAAEERTTAPCPGPRCDCTACGVCEP
jgi:radical SAM superfamily enzyme YgiQ (UPF0313 family)